MGIFRKYPYTNFHELNMDWLLEKMRELIIKVDNFVIDTTDTIIETVNNWLDSHPEYTTTVMDGSLTESKFADSLKLKTIKDYVTPQMYGGLGDGVNDDTNAIQDAINSNKPVFLPKGTYSIHEPLIFNRGSYIFGEGSDSIIKVASGSISNKNPAMFCSDSTSSFNLTNFRLDLNNQDCRGIKITNPYDNCIIKNLDIDNVCNAGLYIGDEAISQTLVIDNVIIRGSKMVTPYESLAIFIKVYELNLYNSKFLFRQIRMGTDPCIILNRCWNSYVRGNSFGFSALEGIRLIGSSRYFRIVYNTYENVGNSDAVDNNNAIVYASGFLINTVSLNTASPEILHGYIEETQYYNCADTINIVNGVGNLIIGPLSMICDNLSYRNSCIYTLYGEAVGNCNIRLGSHIAVDGDFTVKGAQHDYTLRANETSGTSYGVEIRKDNTGQARFNNGNIYNMVNNGAFVVKDSDGHQWFIRVNTSGVLTVTAS